MTETLTMTAASGSLTQEDGIAWLVLDDPTKKVNTLSTRLFEWFEEQVSRAERERPDALVILSGKPDGFVAGADLEELLAAADKEAVLAMLQRGHDLMERLAGLPFPTVAAIHGACLGGGLETALACRYRIASDHPKTVLALPEVQLGLIPGAGGTQRLPRLIGVRNALDMILTGKNIRAKKALQMGLVDEMVHPAILLDVAVQRAQELVDRTLKPRRGSRGLAGAALPPGAWRVRPAARGQSARPSARLPESARTRDGEDARPLSGAPGGAPRGAGRLREGT